MTQQLLLSCRGKTLRCDLVANSENDGRTTTRGHSAKCLGTVAQIEREPLMCVALALEPTEPTVLKAHLVHSQDQRMSRVFIDSQEPYSVKSPVSTQAGPRKSKSKYCSTWQPPSRRTEQPRYVYPIRFRHLMVHSEFSPLVCPTSRVESKLGRLSCAGGKCTSVFYHHVPEESIPPNTDPAQAYFYPIQRPHPGPSTRLCSRSPRYVARCPDVRYRSSWRPKTVGSTPTHRTYCD